jgi:molybdopterin/thiamine biosynthesis adenylyltransferase/rhodanese-related sulfurtransferase
VSGVNRTLSPIEIRRYGRHLVMPEIGVEGQERLKAARVLLVGAGGLGSPAALYLAAAGVGTLGLVEFDVVDESNLQRQILYGDADLGRPKVEAAAERLRATNPHIHVEAHAGRFDVDNARELVRAHDLVVDGSDNFPTRYLVNDACVLERRPNVWGSVFRFEGQASIFAAPGGPCYRCLFPEPPPPGLVPSCAEAGVFGALPGIVGALQAAQAIHWITGVGEPLVGRLLILDALTMSFREVRVPKDPACPVCSEHPTQTGLVRYDDACETPVPTGDRGDLEPRELARRLTAGEAIELLDVRLEREVEIASLPGARWIPLHELADRVAELPRERTIVAYCHVGARSAMAADFLRQQGFAPVFNLAGGIEAWSLDVDPTVPRY